VSEAADEPRRRPLKQEQQPASTEVIEVGPAVLRLQIPIFFTGLGHVNCYALLDDRGATIVDAGMPGRATWHALSARLKAAGLKVSDVHTVIVTHSHPDHFGSAGRLAHEAGAELVTERGFHTWLEPKAAAAARRPSAAFGPHSAAGDPHSAHEHLHAGVSSGPDACSELLVPTAGGDAPGEDGEPGNGGAGDELAVDDDTGFFSITSAVTPWGGSPIPHLRRNIWMTRLARWHLLPYVRPPVPTHYVRGGDHLRLAGRDWEVLHTPGHTGDHVCLFDAEAKLLISGDHVLPTITPHVPGLSPLADPLGSYLESLQGLRRLGDVSLVLPAHGHPFADLPGRIDSIVAHHEGRLDELRRISAALGPATVVDLSRELFRPAVWGMMAESETYAHLEYLRLRGQAERMEIGGATAYRVEPEAAQLS
jgi:glyoxylase-like metal-dependent hydrolase (beta-lactamase superfamily II)